MITGPKVCIGLTRQVGVTIRSKLLIFITILSVSNFGVRKVFGDDAYALADFVPLRSVASIYEQTLNGNNDSTSAKKIVKEVLRINCESLKNKVSSQLRNIASTSEVVMIQFENCSQKEFQNLKIKNANNGYQAEVFRNNKKIVSTDFIQLNAGNNILEFEYRLNPEQKINHQLKIQRQ
jgi:hypothetical protein